MSAPYSGWTITFWPTVSSSLLPPQPFRDPRDTRGYAQHLRGRVHGSRGRWWIEIVNVSTGRVINTDNGHRGLDHAFLDAEARTQAARHAWMSGFRQKDLARGSGGCDA